MPPKTLQIALLGGNEDAILVGLRNFPAHRLVLISTADYAAQAKELSARLGNSLRLDVELRQTKDASSQVILETIGSLLRTESDHFQHFLVNVGSANRQMTRAGVTAAFVHGIDAFDVAGDTVELLPIMKFSYAQVLAGPKMQILEAIQRAGGDVESLENLCKASKFGKPLLSYHINGTKLGRGLRALGLVEVERGKRGRLRVRLTTLGKMLLLTRPTKQVA